MPSQQLLWRLWNWMLKYMISCVYKRNSLLMVQSAWLFGSSKLLFCGLVGLSWLPCLRIYISSPIKQCLWNHDRSVDTSHNHITKQHHPSFHHISSLIVLSLKQRIELAIWAKAWAASTLALRPLGIYTRSKLTSLSIVAPGSPAHDPTFVFNHHCQSLRLSSRFSRCVFSARQTSPADQDFLHQSSSSPGN